MKMFIIDDEESVRTTLGVFAEMFGCEVELFSSPDECAAFMSADCRCPMESPCCDVLLTDQNMPKMKGLDLVRKMKEMGCLLKINHVGIMSGGLSEAENSAAKELGCRVYSKPVTYEILENWVEELKT